MERRTRPLIPRPPEWLIDLVLLLLFPITIPLIIERDDEGLIIR